MRNVPFTNKIALVFISALVATVGIPAASFAAQDDAQQDLQLSAAALGALNPSASTADLSIQAAAKPTISVKRASTGKVTLKKGATYALGATASEEAVLTYESSAPNKVSVSNAGKLKAQATGSATITVTAKAGTSEVAKSVKVKVVTAKKYKKAKAIKVKASAKKLNVGKTVAIKTTFTPKAASNKNLLYKSSNSKVVAVSDSGKVTAKMPGKAKVTVTSADNKKAKRTLTFKVKNAPVKTALDKYSWAQLKAISETIAAAKSDAAALKVAKKYHLVNASGKLTGATKALTLGNGTKTSVRIVGFRHDKKTSGGKAGITFEFADAPVLRDMGVADNTGGWKEAPLRTWLNTDFYNLLPTDLRDQVVEVSKMTNSKGQLAASDGVSVVTATPDKVWLPSFAEVYGKMTYEGQKAHADVYAAEGPQYQLYADSGVTTNDNYSFCVKCYTGKTAYCWLRSSWSSEYAFHSIGGHGGLSGAVVTPYSVYGVSPGFCI